jgi:hypothetical protein
MNVYVRTLSVVALLGTALAALNQYRPAWAARMQFDWWSLPALHEQIRRGEQESADLDARCREITARVLAREAVIRDLRAGRLTLAQAAARFRDINGPDGKAPLEVAGRFGGATEEERLCRQVIAWAEVVARYESPGAAEPMRRGLEAELAALLARNSGVIRLPR